MMNDKKNLRRPLSQNAPDSEDMMQHSLPIAAHVPMVVIQQFYMQLTNKRTGRSPCRFISKAN
jgi:hypothetical protein